MIKWVGYKQTVEIQGNILTLGNFYVSEDANCLLGDILVDDSIEVQSKAPFTIPCIVSSLPVSRESEGCIIRACSGYPSLSPAERYCYLMLLAQKPIQGSKSAYLLKHYLLGMQIRMFVDANTTTEDRVGIIKGALKLREISSKLDDILADFIAAATYKFDLYGINALIPSDWLYAKKLIFGKYLVDVIKQTKKINRTTVFEYYSHHIHPSINRDAVSYIIDGVCASFAQQIRDIRQRYESSLNRQHYAITFPRSKKACIRVSVGDCGIPQGELDAIILSGDKIILGELSILEEYNKIMRLAKNEDCVGTRIFMPINLRGNDKRINILFNLLDSMLKQDEFIVITPSLLLNELLGFRDNCRTMLDNGCGALVFKRLATFGYHLYPNNPFVMQANSKLVLFKSIPNYTTIRNDFFTSLEIFVNTSIFVIQEDGVREGDCDVIHNFLIEQGADDYLTKYFMSYFWLNHNKVQHLKPSLVDALTSISIKTRTMITNAIKSFAIVDNYVNDERLDQIERIYASLKLNWKTLRSELENVRPHKNASVRQKTKSKSNFVALNQDKIRIFEEQTRDAQNILFDIFGEDEVSTASSSNKADSCEEIIEILLTKQAWERSEFEKLCKEKGLLVGATLEKINDIAYDKAGDILIDDCGDILYINEDLKAQLI